jgi:quercetin dioxygenase-like cupin family protein
MNPNDKDGEGCNKVVYKDELQPEYVEHYTADNVYIMQINIPKKDSLVPQHSHAYDHMTILAKGSVRIWEDGVDKGIRTAPSSIFIKAGVKHTFCTFEDDTLLYCIHNISRTGKVEIAEEHLLDREKLCLSV